MDSSTKTEPTLNTSHQQHMKSDITTYCSKVPSDSMKDMDWLNSIELKMLNDSTKMASALNKRLSTDSCSSEPSLIPHKNEALENNETNSLNYKSIRNIIDQIRAKNTKEEIDIQLLEKLTKLLHVSPNNPNQTLEKLENNIDPSKIDDGLSDCPITSSELPSSQIISNDNNYNVSDEVQNLLSVKRSPCRGDGIYDEDKLKPLDYKNDNTLKPPYSYSTLIKMAMKSNHKECITLLNIYEWIKTNFAYYRNVDSCWQNSIRHNLSLNKCFVRVPRESGDHGKGGYWKYVESNDTSDSRYTNKTYSRSLSTGVSTLNCYRSKKYHRRNNKNLSVIVQPFDQFQPQQTIKPFTNMPALQNQLFNQFATQLNTTNNHCGYQNFYGPSSSVNNCSVPSFSENNVSTSSNTYQQSQSINILNSSSDIQNYYKKTLIPDQGIIHNGTMVSGCEQQLTNHPTIIGPNLDEVNPILEAMKYPLTYYNNLANSASKHHFQTNDGIQNTANNNGVDKEFTQSLIDNITQLKGENTSLQTLLCGNNSNQYSADLLNSLTNADSNTTSYESLQRVQETHNNSAIAANHISNGFIDNNNIDTSSGTEYKSLSSKNSSISSSFDGNDLYNYYLSELGIIQQQQKQQINPQIQRLYNVLGGTNLHQR